MYLIPNRLFDAVWSFLKQQTRAADLPIKFWTLVGNTMARKKSVRYKYFTDKFWLYMLKNNCEILPQDWIISEKSLATVGQTFNAKVITGNATAPPPSEVIPKKL